MDRMQIRNKHINQITTIHGNDRTEPIYYSADRMFPKSPDVHISAYLQGFYSASPYLMKNDLNGLFPTDQPGQPFTWDIRERAGIGVRPDEPAYCFMRARNPGHT
jgi:hypothetical protein